MSVSSSSFQCVSIWPSCCYCSQSFPVPARKSSATRFVVYSYLMIDSVGMLHPLLLYFFYVVIDGETSQFGSYVLITFSIPQTIIRLKNSFQRLCVLLSSPTVLAYVKQTPPLLYRTTSLQRRVSFSFQCWLFPNSTIKIVINYSLNYITKHRRVSQEFPVSLTSCTFPCLYHKTASTRY